MENVKKEPTTIVVENVEAWKKKMMEKQFSDIFNRGAEQWKAGSQYLTPTHP